MTSSPVRRFLEAEIRKGTFPGARYRVARRAEVLEDGWVGHSVIEPDEIPVSADTIYDLASLTKPLVTGALAVLLAHDGAIRIDAPLEKYLPEASGRWIGGATLLDLLAHRSGLPAWLPLYLKAANRSEYLRQLLALPVDYLPGTRVTYSCLGYILVALALERVCGTPLDELAKREIFSRLDLESTCFNPDPSLRHRIAATEHGNVREQEIAGEVGRGFHGWRKDVIWGECHDLNAFTLGGISGNAGLFSTMRDLHVMALEFLEGKAGLYDASSLAHFRSDLTPRLNENRSVGWQLARTPDCSAGPLLSPGSMGHTGFTGTSLWMDPQEGWILVLLTNRVHPRYRPDDMNAVRRRFHRLAIHGE